MLNYNNLKKTRKATSDWVECPVEGCDVKVKRMSQSGLNLNSDKNLLKDYYCTEHKIFISPSTFEYEDELDNLLWNDKDDLELLKNLSNTGVKRESRMARENSEDSLTWNVFRYLETKTKLLGKYLEIILKKMIVNPNLIYWSWDQKENKVYQLLADARREFGEAENRGSEPDLICETDDAIIIIEAKFTSGNNTSGSGDSFERHLNNPKQYVSGADNWFSKVFSSDYKEIIADNKYELMRFWLLGTWMAESKGKKFYLVNLVREHKEKEIETEFKKHILETKDRTFHRVTWEIIFRFCSRQFVLPNWDIFYDYFTNKTIGYNNKQMLKKAFFKKIKKGNIMRYSKQQTIETIIDANGNLKMPADKIYKENSINWKGVTTDTDEYYSEILAKELLMNLKELENITPISRTSSYKIPSHRLVEINLEEGKTDREKLLAKRLTGLKFDFFGKFIDYEIPLKDTNQDEGVGKIDNVSYNENYNVFYLVEVKTWGNDNDTLLRSVMEIYTYYKQVDKIKLLNDFGYPDAKVVPAVLLTEDCRAYDEKEFLDHDERPMLKSLIFALGVKVNEIHFNIYGM
jgi:uncharacterized protein (UPF0248 family)